MNFASFFEPKVSVPPSQESFIFQCTQSVHSLKIRYFKISFNFLLLSSPQSINFFFTLMFRFRRMYFITPSSTRVIEIGHRKSIIETIAVRRNNDRHRQPLHCNIGCCLVPAGPEMQQCVIRGEVTSCKHSSKTKTRHIMK